MALPPRGETVASAERGPAAAERPSPRLGVRGVVAIAAARRAAAAARGALGVLGARGLGVSGSRVLEHGQNFGRARAAAAVANDAATAAAAEYTAANAVAGPAPAAAAEPAAAAGHRQRQHDAPPDVPAHCVARAPARDVAGQSRLMSHGTIARRPPMTRSQAV